MSDDKDIIIIFVSSTTGSLAASRVRDGYNYNRIPNKTVATPYPGDIENMRQRRNIHPSSGHASSSGGTDDEPEAAKAIGRFLPRQASVLTVFRWRWLVCTLADGHLRQ